MRNKLEALKHAVGELKNGKDYDWLESHQCNCGIVAQSVTGMKNTPHKLAVRGIGSWGLSICGASGMPYYKVFQWLFDAGFTKKDIMNLEGLCDEKICGEMGMPIRLNMCGTNEGCNDKNNLIAYLEAWIRIIEKEQEPQVKELPAPKMQFEKYEKMAEKTELIYAN